MAPSRASVASFGWLALTALALAPSTAALEPVSMSVVGVGVGAAGLYASINYIKCRFWECCDGRAIAPNITGLARSLRQRLHGQHLATDIVVKALSHHLKAAARPRKALVLSFHGWTGTGKNFVSSLVAEHLYAHGLRSRFVHLWISTLHFPHAALADVYKDQIRQWIRSNVSECPQSLFIFDEVDKMPATVVDAIKPFIDHYETIDGVDYRRAIFLLLSNTGGHDINEVAMQNWKSGKRRQDLSMKDVEPLLLRGAFNEKGGLQYSFLLQNQLVDFLVPFLPMEREHVKMCVLDEMRERKVQPLPNLVDRVVEELQYLPAGQQLFSTSGCKLVGQKLAVLLEMEHSD